MLSTYFLFFSNFAFFSFTEDGVISMRLSKEYEIRGGNISLWNGDFGGPLIYNGRMIRILSASNPYYSSHVNLLSPKLKTFIEKILEL